MYGGMILSLFFQSMNMQLVRLSVRSDRRSEPSKYESLCSNVVSKLDQPCHVFLLGVVRSEESLRDLNHP